MPGLGHKSFLQWATKESSYGNGSGTINQKLEIINFDATPEIGAIDDPSLYSAVSRRGVYQGGMLWRVRFTVRANFEGMLELFRSVLPIYDGATVVETTVRTHLFKEGPNLNSYAPEFIWGDIPSGKCFKVQGLKLTGFRVRATAGQGVEGMLQIEFSGLAKDVLSDQTITVAGSPAFPALFPVIYHYSGNATGVNDDGIDTGANTRIRSFELSYEQPHTEDRFYMTSQLMDEPLRNDFIVARWQFTVEFANKNLFEAARAFTVGSPQMIFAHPTTIGTTKKREMEFRSGSAVLKGWSSPVEGYGVILSTATWEAFQHPADASALVARIQTTEAALT